MQGRARREPQRRDREDVSIHNRTRKRRRRGRRERDLSRKNRGIIGGEGGVGEKERESFCTYSNFYSGT
jgi:hypothetical protein